MGKENKENVNVEPAQEVNETVDNEYLVSFRKPYLFENKEYNEIDLSDMENLSTYQLIETEKEFLKDNNYINILSETTTELACIIATKVTKKPIDFFYNLPAYEGKKINQMVMGFFYQ